MIKRREIMRNGLRVGGLTVLAALAAALGVRRLRQEECRKMNPCGDCPLLSNCELPRARRANPEENHA